MSLLLDDAERKLESCPKLGLTVKEVTSWAQAAALISLAESMESIANDFNRLVKRETHHVHLEGEVKRG